MSSGISPAFAELSPIQGQVAHALLTRAPLYSPKQAWDFSYDLHVLGTPPAFILSQDQTRHLKCETKKSWLLKQECRTHEIYTLFSFQRSKDTKDPYCILQNPLIVKLKKCHPQEWQLGFIQRTLFPCQGKTPCSRSFQRIFRLF